MTRPDISTNIFRMRKAAKKNLVEINKLLKRDNVLMFAMQFRGCLKIRDFACANEYKILHELWRNVLDLPKYTGEQMRCALYDVADDDDKNEEIIQVSSRPGEKSVSGHVMSCRFILRGKDS